MSKLYTCALSKLRDFPEIKNKYFIVRFNKDVHIDGLKHLPELSPSPELLSRTKKAQADGSFDFGSYKDELLEELANEEKAISVCDDIGIKLDSGEDVLLVCFCPNPNICHRKIIAEVFESNGYNVEVR